MDTPRRRSGDMILQRWNGWPVSNTGGAGDSRPRRSIKEDAMIRCLSLACVILIGAATASAQDAVDALLAERPPAEAPADPVAVDGPVVDKPAYDPETDVTRQLNAEVDARNRAVRESNAAAEAEFERRMRDHAEWTARLEREHQAEQAAYEAEVRRRQQAHEADLAAWRRRVADCQRGVAEACAQPIPR